MASGTGDGPRQYTKLVSAIYFRTAPAPRTPTPKKPKTKPDAPGRRDTCYVRVGGGTLGSTYELSCEVDTTQDDCLHLPRQIELYHLVIVDSAAENGGHA